MLATRDRIRLRYLTLKLRALCWLVERLRARGNPARVKDGRSGTAATGN